MCTHEGLRGKILQLGSKEHREGQGKGARYTGVILVHAETTNWRGGTGIALDYSVCISYIERVYIYMYNHLWTKLWMEG